VVLLGGAADYSSDAGAFCLAAHAGSTVAARNFGARLAY